MVNRRHGSGQDYDATSLSETLIDVNDPSVWKSWDITAALQDWIDTGTANGIALVTKSSDLSKYAGASFFSSDYATDTSICPKLIIEFKVMPIVSYDYDYNTGGVDMKVTANYANGWVETDEYSSRGLLHKRQYTYDSDNVFQVDNTYDASGYLTQQYFEQGDEDDYATLTYEPDDLNRLKDFKVGGVSQRTYTYDDNGNITTIGGTTLTYGTPGTNRVTSDGSNNYVYDESGRVTKIGADSILYDHRNLMTHYAYTNNGNYDVKNKFDAAGRRVRKDTDSEARFYLHSGDQVLAEYTTDLYPDAEYIYAGDRRIAKLKSVDDDVTRAPVSLKAISKRLDDGNNAELYVDATNYAISGRGYILVVVDETSGAVIDQQQFDTCCSNPLETDDMADYINALPYGRIVLVGIRDEGSAGMNENAYQALESLGSKYCRDVKWRDSHAFIGRKGAIPGTVPEMHTPRYSGPATAEVHKVDCRIQSAGFDDGKYARFWVNVCRKVRMTRKSPAEGLECTELALLPKARRKHITRQENRRPFVGCI